MKRVYLKTFGCRTNQEESISLGEKLKKEDMIPVKSADEADLVLINGCSVTKQAEAKLRRYIQSIRRDLPGIQIALTGCTAQNSIREISENTLDWIIGNSSKQEIAGILSREEPGVYREDVTIHTPVSRTTEVPPPAESRRTRFSLKIQEGCNRRCSYCIVPYLRGPSRSVPAEEVLKTARKAIQAGYREIIITGTHIGQYRHGAYTWLEILAEVAAMDSGVRLRLSSMNPEDISDELIDLMGERENICRHLHISFQSLSSAVLRRMNRSPRAVTALRSRLDRLTDLRPGVSVGGDFIVGHPGEGEEAFLETLRLLPDYHITYGHVFRFSPRPGTAAAEMSDSVNSGRAKERSRALRTKIESMKKAFYASQKNTVCRIITEKPGVLQGITDNYIPVTGSRKGRSCVLNESLAVRLGDLRKNKVYATAVE
ncbi:MAG: MiaB/RimO family radical SAM methylthiotransferase [Fibrobacterota bacterium]